MANLIAAIKLLEEHRSELVEQLDAINTAIAALKGTGRAESRPRSPAVPPLAAPPAPRKPKRQFALSDEHKRKLVEGRRRAREARAGAAADRASDEPASVINTWKADGPPRLVKHESAASVPTPETDSAHIRPPLP